jgi:D-glycero-D-manno-heptose 1,7-bisphosphate phosphatase
VYLDRDGVVNHDSDAFIKSPSEWIPLPGAIDAIRRLSALGIFIAICSNQSGVARRIVSAHSLAMIHRKLFETIQSGGGRVDVIRYCPHGPDDGCCCRKPLPGMILDLNRRFNVSPDRVIMVGDAGRDLESAVRAGVHSVLVRTGHGRRTERSGQFKNVPTFDDVDAFSRAFEQALRNQSTR